MMTSIPLLKHYSYIVSYADVINRHATSSYQVSLGRQMDLQRLIVVTQTDT